MADRPVDNARRHVAVSSQENHGSTNEEKNDALSDVGTVRGRRENKNEASAARRDVRDSAAIASGRERLRAGEQTAAGRVGTRVSPANRMGDREERRSWQGPVGRPYQGADAAENAKGRPTLLPARQLHRGDGDQSRVALARRVFRAALARQQGGRGACRGARACAPNRFRADTARTASYGSVRSRTTPLRGACVVPNFR